MKTVDPGQQQMNNAMGSGARKIKMSEYCLRSLYKTLVSTVGALVINNGKLCVGYLIWC
jgi:hypothetical protein